MNQELKRMASLARMPQETVQVIVGKNKNVFNVWKSLLCDNSPYFDRALNGPFKESCGTVVLEEEDPEAFGLFVEWICTGDYAEHHTIRLWSEPFAERAQEDTPTHRVLVLLWVLADYLGVPRLQNLVAKRLVSKMDRLRHQLSDVVQLVYEKTALGSPLRKIFVEQAYFNDCSPSTWFLDHPEYFPQQFLLEFTVLRHDDERVGNRSLQEGCKRYQVDEVTTPRKG